MLTPEEGAAIAIRMTWEPLKSFLAVMDASRGCSRQTNRKMQRHLTISCDECLAAIGRKLGLQRVCGDLGATDQLCLGRSETGV